MKQEELITKTFMKLKKPFNLHGLNKVVSRYRDLAQHWSECMFLTQSRKVALIKLVVHKKHRAKNKMAK